METTLCMNHKKLRAKLHNIQGTDLTLKKYKDSLELMLRVLNSETFKKEFLSNTKPEFK